MTLWQKLAVGIMIAAGIAAASPVPCTTGTLTSYVALGSTGCTIDNVLFTNFTDPAFTNSLGVSALTTDEFLVTPSFSGDEDTLAITYQTLTGAPQTVTVNQNGQQFAFDFTFQAQAINSQSLQSLQMTSTFANTAPGNVSATKNAQLTTGGSLFTSTIGDGGVSNPMATYSGPVTAVTGGTGLFNVEDAISLQAQSGSASSSGFTNNFFEEGTAQTPEPGVAILIGSGLLGFGLIRRRAVRPKNT